MRKRPESNRRPDRQSNGRGVTIVLTGRVAARGNERQYITDNGGIYHVYD